MAAGTQVALRQKGLGCQREPHGKRRYQERERRARRIKPDNPHRGEGQSEGRPHELSAKTGEKAEHLHIMAALGHVRGQPTLEIAIAEAGIFCRNAIRRRAPGGARGARTPPRWRG